MNVALLAFPQGMAYAAIAGLPIQYGIYGSAIAALIGPLLSGSRFVVLGPTNATAVLVFASFLSLGVTDMTQKVQLMALVVLLSGLFLVLGAFLKVANLIQYISRSVVTGYITAAAIYIIVNQIKKVLGFEFALPQGSTFLTVIWLTLKNLPATHWPTLFISLMTFGCYWALDRKFKMLPNVAITLVLMSFIAHWVNVALAAQNIAGAHTLYAIDATHWHFNLPPLRFDLIGQVASVALVIAFLSVLEGTSIGKSLASRSGQKLDSNQEMLGMGLANIACSLYQGMPASGSLTRSQLNWASGATSPLASMIAGLLCAVGAYAFGPMIHYIPISVLAVLVITIGISLINRHVIRIVWNATASDRIVFITTFAAALLIRLDFAIILGTGISVLLFLRKAAQPELTEFASDAEGHLTPMEQESADSSPPEISIVHVEGDLFFGASELFRDQMRRVCEKPSLKVVILKMRNAYHLDATSVLALEELVRTMREQNRSLLVTELRKDAIRVFRNSGLIEVLGRENIFPDNPSNPTLATAKALRRAKQLMGGQEADVKIFLGKSRKQEQPGG